jgi:hypothetical protein
MTTEERGVFRCYKPKNFRPESLKTISMVNRLIDHYAAQGMSVSVRQIYYRLVAADLIPNTVQSYKNTASLISDGRMAGLISWDAIEDRNRQLSGLQHWNGAVDALKEVRGRYRIDKWATQPWRPEVWVEKAALEGVVGQVCNDLEVDFLALRGYNSQSEAWAAGRRFARYIGRGQRPIVFHLGDHDPSGLDMTRDNRERISLFAGTPIMLQRLALNRDQIDEYDPPPNPAKETDSRYEGYSAEHGDESWELDALEPSVIKRLIADAVDRLRDPDVWAERVAQEVEDKRELDDAIQFIGGTPYEEPEQ